MDDLLIVWLGKRTVALLVLLYVDIQVFWAYFNCYNMSPSGRAELLHVHLNFCPFPPVHKQDSVLLREVHRTVSRRLRQEFVQMLRSVGLNGACHHTFKQIMKDKYICYWDKGSSPCLMPFMQPFAQVRSDLIRL